MTASDVKPRLLFRQDLTESFFLSVYLNNAEKLADIPLGSNDAEARKKASRIISCMVLAGDFEDQTQDPKGKKA